ncbi:MAG: molecular chaperone TorD family protein [Planctomycetota bacterium]
MSANTEKPDFSGLRASSLEWVAHVLLFELDQAHLDELLSGPIPEMLDQFVPGTADELEAAARSKDACDELAAEFARLFLIPSSTAVVPIVTSWVEDGEPIRDLAVRWSTVVEELGVPPYDQQIGRIPPTHIAAVLRAYAFTTGDETMQSEIEATAVPPIRLFAESLRDNAQAPFYRALGIMLGGLLATC